MIAYDCYTLFQNTVKNNFLIKLKISEAAKM